MAAPKNRGVYLFRWLTGKTKILIVMTLNTVRHEQIMLAITGAQLIDGLRSAPIPSSVVLIGRDGRIIAAGPPQQVPVPAGVTTLEAAGMTLLPGLIDGHVHLTWDKTLYTLSPVDGLHGHLRPPNAERELVRAGHYAQLALTAGVTTLRDCGADDCAVLALRDMINAHQFVGPRLLVAGRPITTTGGHLFSGWAADDADAVRAAVRTMANQGVDFIKLVASGGRTTPVTKVGGAQYTLEEMTAAVEEAHRLGLQVAAHAISTASIRLVAEAGVDTIEHCAWIGPDARTAVTDEAAVDWMVKNGLCVDHALIPRAALFPDEWGNAPTADEELWLSQLRVRWPFLHHMRKRGVCVFLGTDAGFGPWPGTTFWPGFQDLARALEVLVRYGTFAPTEALQMVTGQAARALRLDREIGTIETGKRADLILLAADPLQNIKALRDVDKVFRDGHLVAQKGAIVLAEPPETESDT
jgi:imidazolonepropionase-like amidohydrolase